MSSSGAGAGVAPAAGLCYGAIGTDTGGSIRFPSGANAITGLKPTWGRVSRHGVQALADSLDHLGPMTRCAADAGAGAMFAAMAGMDPNDPTTLEEPVPDCLASIEQGIAGLRIAIDPGFVCGVCQPETAKVIDEARRVLAALGALGAKVVELPMPDRTTPMYKDWAKYCAVETAVAHEPWCPAHKAEYGPVLADLIEQGRAMDALTLTHVHHDRLVFQGQLRRLFLDVDLLLMPVHPFGNPSAAALDEIASRRPTASMTCCASRRPSTCRAARRSRSRAASTSGACRSASSWWGGTWTRRCWFGRPMRFRGRRTFIGGIRSADLGTPLQGRRQRTAGVHRHSGIGSS